MSETRTLDCDVCIFGTGAVGLYLADVLSRDSETRVVLLEAGPEHFRDRKEPYAVKSTGKLHKGVNEARVTVFGGATNTWGGGLIRLSANDLQPLPGMPETGWPIDYAELSGHYELVEGDLELPAEVSAEAGEFRRRDMTMLPFQRKNFAQVFGPGLSQRPSVTMVFEVGLPEGLELSGGKLQAIALATREGALRVTARHFVIAAGVVNSIILAKKILNDPPAHLGRFIQDHLSIPLFAIQPKSSEAFSRRFGYRVAKGFMFAERYETAGFRPGGYFHFTYEFAASRPLAAIKRVLESLQQGAGLDWRALGRMLLGAGTMMRIAAMRVLAGRLFVPADVPVTGVLDLEQVPDWEWRIDPHGNFLGCEMNWDIGKADIGNAGRQVRALRQLLPRLAQEAGFSWKELFPDPEHESAAFEAYVRSSAWDTYHCSGGLRMGTDPRTSVVSPSLALHGIDNVHVVSTAVFPRVGSVNPTLTLLALARRLVGALRTAV